MSSMSSVRRVSVKHREGLAREAARIIAQGQAPDYQGAKNKALHNLGLPTQTPLPSNQEIELALLDHQSLFAGDQARSRLCELRRGALQAMHEFEAFKPRLTGAVLRGSTNQSSAVCLHLFAETIEEVGFFLMDSGIPFRHIEQRLDFGAGVKQNIPVSVPSPGR